MKPFSLCGRHCNKVNARAIWSIKMKIVLVASLSLWLSWGWALVSFAGEVKVTHLAPSCFTTATFWFITCIPLMGYSQVTLLNRLWCYYLLNSKCWKCVMRVPSIYISCKGLIRGYSVELSWFQVYPQRKQQLPFALVRWFWNELWTMELYCLNFPLQSLMFTANQNWLGF